MRGHGFVDVCVRASTEVEPRLPRPSDDRTKMSRLRQPVAQSCPGKLDCWSSEHSKRFRGRCFNINHLNAVGCPSRHYTTPGSPHTSRSPVARRITLPASSSRWAEITGAPAICARKSNFFLGALFLRNQCSALLRPSPTAPRLDFESPCCGAGLLPVLYTLRSSCRVVCLVLHVRYCASFASESRTPGLQSLPHRPTPRFHPHHRRGQGRCSSRGWGQGRGRHRISARANTHLLQGPARTTLAPSRTNPPHRIEYPHRILQHRVSLPSQPIPATTPTLRPPRPHLSPPLHHLR